MMEHDAVTQTMYIAALGTEYTFKAAGASAKIIMSLIEKIAEKARLTTADKKLLRLASDDVATAVTIKNTDLKSFKTYAKDFGLTYVVVGNKHQVETGLLDVIVRQDQLARVNEFLNRIGYGKVVEDTSKKDSPSMYESTEPTRESGDSMGIDPSTMSPEMFERYLLYQRTKDNPVSQKFVEGDLTSGEKDYKTPDLSTMPERLEPPDLDRIDRELMQSQANLGVVEKKESYIDTIIDKAEGTAFEQNAERIDKAVEKVSAVVEKIETVIEAK